MNWIWEDSASYITIDIKGSCLKAHFELRGNSSEKLSDYICELKMALNRFGEIFPDLGVLISYQIESNLTDEEKKFFVEQLLLVLNHSKAKRVALLNNGTPENHLDVDGVNTSVFLPITQIRQYHIADQAIAWLKTSAALVL
jgi:hypothetical protein